MGWMGLAMRLPAGCIDSMTGCGKGKNAGGADALGTTHVKAGAAGSGIRAGMRVLSSAADAEMEGGRRGAASGGMLPTQGAEIDYDLLGDSVATAFIRRGLGRPVITLDGREVGRAVEPSVSRASYQRGQRTAVGRAARMRMVG